MSNILIVSALHQEIPDKYEGGLENHSILYTGVGNVYATYELTKLIKSMMFIPKLVINYGTAGSRNIPLHTLVDCVSFVQRDMDKTALGFKKGETAFEKDVPMILGFPFSAINNPIRKNLSCGTGDNFVQDIDKEIDCNVFDMEEYALAKICWKMGKDFVSYKYVTDNANEKSADDWLENCGKGVKEFKKVLKYYDNL